MNKQMLEPTLRYVDVVLPKWDGAARDGMGMQLSGPALAEDAQGPGFQCHTHSPLVCHTVKVELLVQV